MLQLRLQAERWPIRGQFRISRDTFTHSQMIVVEISDGQHTGRGECEPHESDPAAVEAAMQSIRALEKHITRGLTRETLAQLMPACPARNALDCALWDLEAKQAGRRAWELIGLPVRESSETAFTLGIDTAEAMAQKATRYANWRLLKIKLGGHDDTDLDRVRAIRHARPDARLIVDANGGWTIERLREMAAALKLLGCELIEQPLPRDADDALKYYRSPVPLCADESCLDRSSLAHVIPRYQYINIKLDKTGGLTEAFALVRSAQAAGVGVMVGCMVGTSLAMAPATLIAQHAQFIDLDGPLLLDKDREPGIAYDNGRILLPQRELWG